MPSDSNGIYSLPAGYLAETGDTIQASQHNPPLEDLAASMSARLMLSGAAPMTGPLKIVDGSVGSPSVKFANAASTGIYKTANGLGVSVGGTQVAEFGLGGMTKGGKLVGELFMWTGASSPDLCVLPYGQTLSRTTHADLWAHAQIEIAAGNTFYNNGNGSTTFGIGDLRGRYVAGKDDIGGVASGRLTSDYFTGTPTIIGAIGGAQYQQIVTANLPPYTPSGTNSAPVMRAGGTTNPQGVQGGSNIAAVSSGSGIGVYTSSGFQILTADAPTFTGNAQGGTQQPFGIIPPSMIVNFALFAGV